MLNLRMSGGRWQVVRARMHPLGKGWCAWALSLQHTRWGAAPSLALRRPSSAVPGSAARAAAACAFSKCGTCHSSCRTRTPRRQCCAGQCGAGGGGARLLKVRHVPQLVHRVAVEAAAEVVADAAGGHLQQRRLCHALRRACPRPRQQPSARSSPCALPKHTA